MTKPGECLDFVKFPSTPHLLWLSSDPVRSDKVMSPAEAREFMETPVVVEEKIDGSNLGISFTYGGELRVQSRGDYFDMAVNSKFRSLEEWIAVRESRLRDLLEDNLIMYGEWCALRHSIYYSRLPDRCLVFDVYDRATGRFWSVCRRDELVRRAGLHTVPFLARGLYGLETITDLISTSTYGEAMMEGLYLRGEDDVELHRRAKIVREGHVGADEEHWSGRTAELNGVAWS